MMNKETGGSAFPVPGLNRGDYNNGMTLRDYFAAQALHSMQSISIETEDGLPKQIAKWAYSVADAMLKAREQ